MARYYFTYTCTLFQRIVITGQFSIMKDSTYHDRAFDSVSMMCAIIYYTAVIHIRGPVHDGDRWVRIMLCRLDGLYVIDGHNIRGRVAKGSKGNGRVEMGGAKKGDGQVLERGTTRRWIFSRDTVTVESL